ncbi:helix-turn-helix transcriptional regulator [Agromyces sp. Soil535]|uniref:helix-turn-helix transcriptional regulator n=1 Tax=Agromyces sp. Soil535 TaxID=1736390 RepID=UPI0006F5B323|nr:helix-turn-helix transcriptional regulator [Agromyces sp. Soil535]KRE21764.1 hypothetical protein ASG80_11730 [Agromyces sp. Soil535]
MIRGLAVLALLDATQARAREAVANLGEAERTGLARFGEPRILTMVDCVHAELALLDPSRSPQLPERTLYRVDGAVQLWHPTLVGRLAIATGRLDDADARVTTLRELGRWSSAAAALADRLEGLRRGATGATRDAADLLAGAADRLAAAGLGLPAHQARLEWAETSVPGAVERDELLELVDYFDTQALRSWGDRARQAARAHNVRVAPRRRAGDGLTRRESEVAELVAEGRSNAEIASALFLSERTVETHLAHIYRRLGLASRSALVRYLTEREQADSQRTD